MTAVADIEVLRAPADLSRSDALVGLFTALLVGGALVWCALAGATPLLAAVAATQALVAASWLIVTELPGRKGAAIIAVAAAGAADVAVSVWPHSRLGTLLAIGGLSVPAMFVHQLMRGAARSRIVASLAGTAGLVLTVVSPAALLQLRHEFEDSGGQTPGGTVAAGVLGAAAGGLLIALVADVISSAPRFDPEVPRGLLGVVASTGLGGSVGYLVLSAPDRADFAGGRGVFVGAAVGVLVGLLAVAVAFAGASSTSLSGHEPPTRAATRLRPVLAVLVPLCVVAPVAFLLCLAVHA